jgi:hypothetical protein
MVRSITAVLGLFNSLPGRGINIHRRILDKCSVPSGKQGARGPESSKGDLGVGFSFALVSKGV